MEMNTLFTPVIKMTQGIRRNFIVDKGFLSLIYTMNATHYPAHIF